MSHREAFKNKTEDQMIEFATRMRRERDEAVAKLDELREWVQQRNAWALEPSRDELGARLKGQVRHEMRTIATLLDPPDEGAAS